MITSEEVIAAYEASGWKPMAFRLFTGPRDNPTGGCALGVVARKRLGSVRYFSLEEFDPDISEAVWGGIASGFNYAFSGRVTDPIMGVGTDKRSSVACGADPLAWERGAEIGRDVRDWWEAKEEQQLELELELLPA